MPEKVLKTYHSNKPFLSLSHPGDGELIQFHNGVLSTDDPIVQEHIEACGFFGRGISLDPSPLEALALSAKDLRAKANVAVQAAEAAEKALADAQKAESPAPAK